MLDWSICRFIMIEYGVDRLIDDIWLFEVDIYIYLCIVFKNLKNLRILKDDYDVGLGWIIL